MLLFEYPRVIVFLLVELFILRLNKFSLAHTNDEVIINLKIKEFFHRGLLGIKSEKQRQEMLHSISQHAGTSPHG